ncbi:MAG: PepSY domain-containing protein [Tannerella sp.]|nr:PepSY domain-containing protein [Tannerella sp.]
MKKIFRKIHLWLSVPFGLIIAIICFSGAMLVFETEIQEWSHPARYFVEEVKEEPIPVGRLMRSVSAQLPDTLSISGVQIPNNPKRNYRMSFTGQNRMAALYVDPYTGDIRDLQLGAQKNFFTVMRQLHRWLMGSFKRDGSFSLGKTVVGISTLLFVFVLISGIIIWIPKTKKALLLRLKIKLKYGWRRFWHDLHVAGGIYAVLLLLAMSLTGLTYSFSWYRNGFYRVFGADIPQMGYHGGAPASQAAAKAEYSESVDDNQDAATGDAPREGRGNRGGGRPEYTGENRREGRGGGRPENADTTYEGRGNRGSRRPENVGDTPREGRSGRGGGYQVGGGNVNYRQWQTVIDQLKTQYPRHKSMTIQDGRVSVALSGMISGRASDSYIFDAQTGDITESTYYKDANKSGKMRGWIYAVHVGSWGGITTRILSFLAALLGTALPLTGYYMWIRRLLSRKRNRQ